MGSFLNRLSAVPNGFSGQRRLINPTRGHNKCPPELFGSITLLSEEHTEILYESSEISDQQLFNLGVNHDYQLSEGGVNHGMINTRLTLKHDRW